ncbi:MAG: CDP-diacylglycerol--glycerol-3-phosphate 3-phosphatidyltransferase [Oscillospiraceae bacterium]|nr:CDP-diacylglycerol--glycerol-3-phosphate 3-phosphatidyltransferase [Oscillospiraceae bacterium]
MNTANKMTLLRVVLIPVFLILLYLNFSGHKLAALGVFILASLTDLADGYVARTYGQVTDFGKFMDPLADKVLVCAAMAWFVEAGQMAAWMLLVVLAREFAVSGLRMLAAPRGVVIAAAWSGKVKTASTMVCVCLMLLPIPGWLNALCLAVILVTTVWSGAEYFIRNRAVFSGGI